MYSQKCTTELEVNSNSPCKERMCLAMVGMVMSLYNCGTTARFINQVINQYCDVRSYLNENLHVQMCLCSLAESTQLINKVINIINDF